MRKTRKQNIEENTGIEKRPVLEENFDVDNAMEDTNVIYGQVTEQGKEICTEHTNRSIVVCGTSGSGKTHCYAKTNIMQAIRRGDAIIFSDGEGELTETFEPILKVHGYEIKRLNLKELENSNSWNCIQEVVYQEKGEISDCRLEQFVNTYVANVGMNRYRANYDDPTVKQLFKAVIAYTAKEKGIAEFTIKDVYENVKKLDDIWMNMDELLEKYEPEKEVYDFNNQSIVNKEGAIHLLRAAMSIFEYDEVIAMTCGSDMGLRTFNKKKQAYIINLPVVESFKPISALFATFAIADIQDSECKRSKEESNPCLNSFLLLDEFARVGKLYGESKAFERALITASRHCMTINVLVQSIARIEQMYGKETAYALAREIGADVIFLGISDACSVEFLKDNVHIGDAAILKTNPNEIVICSHKGEFVCKMLSWNEYPEELKK